MTKLSNKFARAAKRVTSLISAATIAVVGLVAVGAAPAQAAPVTKPQYVNINRSALQDGSITIHNGESLRVVISLNANISSNGTKQMTTNAAVTPNSDLTFGAASYRWNIDGCTGAGMTVTTQIATPCANAASVNLYFNQTITNSSGSDKSITTNASTASITYDGTPLTITDHQNYATRNPSSAELTSGVIYAQGDSYMGGSIQLCFNSSAVAANDVLTWDVSVLNGTTPVSSEVSMMSMNPYIQLQYYTLMNSVTAVTGETYTIDSSTISAGLNLNINSGRLSAGTYHFSVDLKKNGSSVLGTCSMGPGPGGPVSLVTAALGTTGAAVANATMSAEKALGANVTTSTSGRNGPDGQGGLLVLSPALAEGSWTLANVKTTGANAAFARTGKVTLTPGADAMAGSTGWYGAGQSGWAVDFWNMDGGTDVYWGTKTASTVNRRTISQADISTFCTANAGAGFTQGGPGAPMSEFDFVNAPTTAPMMPFECMNPQTEASKSFIVKVATSGITKVTSTTTATGTVAKPCTSIGTYVNPSATGSAVAALLVIANTAKSQMGMGDPSCYGIGGAVGDRRITTITAAGAARTYTTNIPVAAIPVAATGVSIAPGSVAGTWVGVVYGGTQMSSKPTHTIKISSAAIVSKSKTITLDAASVMAQTSSLTPVKQLASGSIVALRRASVMGPGGQSYKYAIAKIDANGKVTTGKILTFTATGSMDMYSTKNIARSSNTPAGVVNYYFVTKYTETLNGNKFKVVTWTNPTR